jgi:hypothetical protein
VEARETYSGACQVQAGTSQKKVQAGSAWHGEETKGFSLLTSHLPCFFLTLHICIAPFHWQFGMTSTNFTYINNLEIKKIQKCTNTQASEAPENIRRTSGSCAPWTTTHSLDGTAVPHKVGHEHRRCRDSIVSSGCCLCCNSYIYTHVISICFKYFWYFRRMFQVFHLDVAEVYPNVA